METIRIIKAIIALIQKYDSNRKLPDLCGSTRDTSIHRNKDLICLPAGRGAPFPLGRGYWFGGVNQNSVIVVATFRRGICILVEIGEDIHSQGQRVDVE